MPRFYRESFPSRESWLAVRRDGIGASDAAAALQISPWVSITQLWEEKTGRRQPKDLSGIEAVQRGVREEPVIRERFITDHPEFLVSYHEFDILHLTTHPYITATLDGEIVALDDVPRHGIEAGMRGVLEIKTGSYTTQRYLDAWTGDVLPEHYFAQVCQQLLVTGWDFAWVQAKLFREDRTYSRGGNNLYLPEQYETFFLVSATDKAVRESMDAVLDADRYLHDCIVGDTMPDVAVPTNRLRRA